ncbi:YsnF/AvaK domain-containing protein [Candidatus Cyanaurora vandensis]|uniref:YsnF/AvaK domain-containing protein n=2 Tax=Candidatus Cyanaurora vandensis TaxID=2714958 RepID=UPI0028F4537B|nr:YsnF/AvaK domain-containing protein [Candidatus Cyanaurora vandensis]
MSTTSSTDVHSSLIGMGLDAEDARELESRLEDGGVLIIVQAGKKGMDALEILKRHGASPADMELNHGSTSTQETMTAESPQRLQLLKEVLKVNKERVQKGEVRLRKEVITETKTMDVPVTHEEVVIERRLVTDETTATGQIGDDQTIRVPLTEEQVKVDKRAVVTEEILVGKREVEETQKVSETVRREELRTDSQGNVIVQDSKRTKP